ncbi:MAG: Ig-like domain-containing protein [Candidatus Xenobiia bacterium LiM19]
MNSSHNNFFPAVVLSIMLLCFSGCGSSSGGGGGSQGGSSGSQSGNKGTILITAPFPAKAAAAEAAKTNTAVKPDKKTIRASRFIPLTVYIYVVTVCEQGTTTAVVSPVNINRPDSGNTVDASVDDVPVGWKTVRVFAYDSNRNILAQGASDVEVKSADQGSTEATVTLASTSDPPSVSSTTPSNAQISVSINTKVTVLFSMSMLASSLSTDTFYLQSSQGKVEGAVTTDGSTAIFTPSSALLPLTTYTAVISGNVKNTAGLSMGTDYTWSFTTGEKPDTTPPQVKETSPVSGAASIDTGATISAVFTKNIDPATVTSSTFTVTSSKAAVSGTISTLGNSVTFVPAPAMQAGAAITVTLSGAIKDLAGNAMGNDYTWNFTTKAPESGGGGGGGGCTCSWTVEKRQPTYNTINDTWATGSDAYFVCDGGVILHHDGSNLTTMTSGTTHNLYDIWGADSSNIYAVGAGGIILYYNGSSWSAMTNPDTGNHDLWGVGGSSTSNIFAVGKSGTILYFDGTSWSDISSKNPDSAMNDLLDVLVEPGSGYVYAVGTDSTVIRRDTTVPTPVWTIIDTGGPTLTSIWAIDNNNVYVAGYSGTVNKWDQTAGSWTTHTSPGSFDIQGIWGTSATNFYVVADSDKICYYNGSWYTMVSQTTGIDFRSVFGTAANNIFATGTGGVIRYFDNTTNPTTGPWTSIPPQLHRVWGSSASDIFATGEHGAIIHNNGSTWSAMSSGTTEWLYGLWGIDSSNVYAVGSCWKTASYTAVMLQYGGTSWNDQTASNPLSSSMFFAIWGSSTSNLYAAGSGGQIIYYDGSTWVDKTGNNPDPAGTKRQINGIWGYGSKVFFVGKTDGSTNKGLIILNNGGSWSIMSNPDTGYHNLNGIWGFSDSDIFAVGDGGVILRCNGTSWSVMSQSLTTNNLFGVWGTSGSDVYAVGDQGTILHWNGSSWSNQTVSGVVHSLRSIWGSSSTNIYSVGSEGIIMHYK